MPLAPNFAIDPARLAFFQLSCEKDINGLPEIINLRLIPTSEAQAYLILSGTNTSPDKLFRDIRYREVILEDNRPVDRLLFVAAYLFILASVNRVKVLIHLDAGRIVCLVAEFKCVINLVSSDASK